MLAPWYGYGFVPALAGAILLVVARRRGDRRPWVLVVQVLAWVVAAASAVYLALAIGLCGLSVLWFTCRA